MAKPDKPLFSLGAKGTIGDALTYQKRGQDTIVRQKPIPKDPYSLNQAYQRWDYRDYAHLWTLLSNSEKQVYRTRASRYHITGFSQFMREQLKVLDGLLGRWHLDELAGATAYDTSRNANNGVIVGASPVDGIIAGAYYLDGINDEITIASTPILNPSPNLSIELFIISNVPDGGDGVSHSMVFNANGQYSLYIHGGGNLNFDDNILGDISVDVGPWGNVKHHICVTLEGTVSKIYFDAVHLTTGTTDRTDSTPGILRFGRRGTNWLTGILDEIRISDFTLDQATITRHSLRQYP